MAKSSENNSSKSSSQGGVTRIDTLGRSGGVARTGVLSGSGGYSQTAQETTNRENPLSSRVIYEDILTPQGGVIGQRATTRIETRGKDVRVTDLRSGLTENYRSDSRITNAGDVSIPERGIKSYSEQKRMDTRQKDNRVSIDKNTTARKFFDELRRKSNIYGDVEISYKKSDFTPKKIIKAASKTQTVKQDSFKSSGGYIRANETSKIKKFTEKIIGNAQKGKYGKGIQEFTAQQASYRDDKGRKVYVNPKGEASALSVNLAFGAIGGLTTKKGLSVLATKAPKTIKTVSSVLTVAYAASLPKRVISTGGNARALLQEFSPDIGFGAGASVNVKVQKSAFKEIKKLIPEASKNKMPSNKLVMQVLDTLPKNRQHKLMQNILKAYPTKQAGKVSAYAVKLNQMSILKERKNSVLFDTLSKRINKDVSLKKVAINNPTLFEKLGLKQKSFKFKASFDELKSLNLRDVKIQKGSTGVAELVFKKGKLKSVNLLQTSPKTFTQVERNPKVGLITKETNKKILLKGLVPKGQRFTPSLKDISFKQAGIFKPIPKEPSEKIPKNIPVKYKEFKKDIFAALDNVKNKDAGYSLFVKNAKKSVNDDISSLSDILKETNNLKDASPQQIKLFSSISTRLQNKELNYNALDKGDVGFTKFKTALGQLLIKKTGSNIKTGQRTINLVTATEKYNLKPLLVKQTGKTQLNLNPKAILSPSTGKQKLVLDTKQVSRTGQSQQIKSIQQLSDKQKNLLKLNLFNKLKSGQITKQGISQLLAIEQSQSQRQKQLLNVKLSQQSRQRLKSLMETVGIKKIEEFSLPKFKKYENKLFKILKRKKGKGLFGANLQYTPTLAGIGIRAIRRTGQFVGLETRGSIIKTVSVVKHRRKSLVNKDWVRHHFRSKPHQFMSISRRKRALNQRIKTRKPMQNPVMMSYAPRLY